MISVDLLMDFENGEMEEKDVITMFQTMINDGSVWDLQGSYGRADARLLEQGLCVLPEHKTFDAYGNRVS